MLLNLPVGITFYKEQRSNEWVYVFRHTRLGQLGRIVVSGRSDGQSQISCEITGDPNDAMTAKRAAIFKPLIKKITAQIEKTNIGAVAGTSSPLSNFPQEGGKGIARKLMQCERCDAAIGIVILAPDAPDEGGLEDYARLMYPEIRHHKVPTWIIGALSPSAGVDHSNESKSIIKKVFPIREPIFYASPNEFNSITDTLREKHCS